MTIYLVVTGIVILIIVSLNLIKPRYKKKQNSVMDTLSEDPVYREMKEIYDVMSKLNEGGTNQDVIPNGYGKFGYEETNPIPVNTVVGSMAYLSSLRNSEGKKVQYERIGSTSAPNIDKPIDMYEISIDGIQIATLYISPYQKKNSERPPEGFKLTT